MILQPLRCGNGHIIAQTGKIREFSKLQKMDIPMHEILDKLGFKGKTRECCRNVFMTATPTSEEEKLNHHTN